jgi:hypothetical protein
MACVGLNNRQSNAAPRDERCHENKANSYEDKERLASCLIGSAISINAGLLRTPFLVRCKYNTPEFH